MKSYLRLLLIVASLTLTVFRIGKVLSSGTELFVLIKEVSPGFALSLGILVVFGGLCAIFRAHRGSILTGRMLKMFVVSNEVPLWFVLGDGLQKAVVKHYSHNVPLIVGAIMVGGVSLWGDKIAAIVAERLNIKVFLHVEVLCKIAELPFRLPDGLHSCVLMLESAAEVAVSVLDLNGFVVYKMSSSIPHGIPSTPFVLKGDAYVVRLEVLGQEEPVRVCIRLGEE